ncbi:type I-F CRISPR-associated protein Csy1 [Oceanimonas sp. MB9]|uniref:type I-F CRISPR-associated protein Csy1 n=1 Tax=Oceanimonas sp. MB9 TaxID=2588453 RepID=UPI0013F5E402|nr:type I-F CRISPR-associated protein Csy1 [Oceanimonas sp. MB9]NHI01888.1 CRISPR-associated protein Csy1 [Oceanimonas sp. MB9]
MDSMLHVEELRQLMQSFIDERLAAKLEKLDPDDPKYQDLQLQYQFENWVEDAARRVGQLQVVSHTLKAIHPDAKGTSLFAPPELLAAHPWVGSHLLEENYATDVVGNAAALDVYKFLKLEYQGKTLLVRAQEQDAALLAALNDDALKAQEWLDAFASITDNKGKVSSSTRAKQIYWLTGDDPTQNDHFHLLSPLYPSSLVHRVYQHIQRDRFSEEAKAARQARRDNKASETGYADYPNLAVQKLGGTKPQNISQLNSERGGNNYLLCSLPPVWRSREQRPPLKADSVFPRFVRQQQSRWLLATLRDFLLSNPPANVRTRTRVDAYIDALIDEMVLFSAHFQQLEPCWSADPDCQLVEAEQLWLDPMRAEQDEDFAARRMAGEWVKEVQHRFANQVNKALGKLPVGDGEHSEWMSRVNKKLNALREVLDD